VIGLLRSCLPATVFDALNYHYALPEIWLKTGAMHDTGATIYDGLAHGMNLLQGFGLVVGGDPAANQLGWLALVLSAIGCLALVRAAKWPTRVGLYAMAMLLSAHRITYEASGGLIDINLLFFAIVASVVALRWLQDRRIGAVLLSGALVGMAGATRQNGLVVALSLTLALGISGTVRYGINSTVKPLLLFLCAFLALETPWLVWAFQVTGNPLHPAFNSLFAVKAGFGAGIGWAEEATLRGFERSIVTYITYPWHLSFNFKLLRSMWEFGIGPGLIAFAPLAIFYRRGGIAMTFSVVAMAVYLSVMYFLAPHMVRYLIPAFAFAALLSFV